MSTEDMTRENDILELISNNYYEFTASEKKTADYVMTHRVEAQSLSISELAEKSDVAEATISRFCRHLGYSGYNAFKLAIAKSAAGTREDLSPLAGEVKEDDNFSDMTRKVYTADIASMTQTFELISEERIIAAADILCAAKTVYCMGQGGSMLLAQDAAHLFSTAGYKFFSIADSHLQAMAASNMGPDDAVLFFSYSGATKDMMHTIEILRRRGAKVVLITRYPQSPGAAVSDVVLQCGSNESPLQLGSVAAKIAQMFLLDVLFTEMSRRDLPVHRDARSRVADALAEKHL